MLLLVILRSQHLLKSFPGQRLRNQALKAPKHRVLADRDSLRHRCHHHAWLKLGDLYTFLSGFNSSAAGETLEFVYVHSVSRAVVSVANYRLAWETKQFSSVMCDNCAAIPSAVGLGKGKKLRRRDFSRSISQVTTKEEFVSYKVQQWNHS